MGISPEPGDTVHEAAATVAPDDGWNWLYIDGSRRSGSGDETLQVRNPATGDTLYTVPSGTEADVDDAFEAATAAQSDWADRSPAERAGVIRDFGRLLGEYSEDIVSLLAVEAGGTTVKSEIECAVTEGMIDVAASLPYRAGGEQNDSVIPGKENLVVREPVGVVGIITPWNYPVNLALRAAIPAIALGNAVVLKPDESTPVVGGLLLARLFEMAGLPSGVFNVVPGDGPTAGAHLAGHPSADVVSFTGSSEVGRSVASTAAERLSVPTLELGGNCPHVVLENADVERAVDAAVFGSFIHQGQGCISINRHLVSEAVYDEYVSRLAERARTLTIGDPRDESVEIGPIIDDGQRDKIVRLLEASVEEGATVEAGGSYEGRFIEPTVLSDVRNDMPVATNEHFGPLAPVIPFDDVEAAIELANDTEYGLAASVHSEDVGLARDVADRIEAGMVHVNDQPVNDDPHAPFGGTKNSGMGRFNDRWILDAFTEPKWISIQREPRDYPL